MAVEGRKLREKGEKEAGKRCDFKMSEKTPDVADSTWGMQPAGVVPAF